MASIALATQWFGTFLYEDGDRIEAIVFPEDADAIADRLTQVREGEILEEEHELLACREAVAVRGDRLVRHEAAQSGPAPRAREASTEHGIDPSLLREATIRLAETTIEDRLSDRTRHLVQAVAYLDETHEIVNTMGERLVAWYRLHAPDAVKAVEDHVELARAIARNPDRLAVRAELGLEGEAIGSSLDPNESQAVEGLARSIVQQNETREDLQTFVDELGRDVAPNLSKLVGPRIAAQLIHLAGGLEALAKLPASTIQMLGAEQAVFEHLVNDAPPPKHGVIFTHPMIREAHPNDRGKIARALAAKLAIAARADALTGNDIADDLKAEVEARAEEVQRIGRRRAKARSEGSR
jgi:nucleolar protein 56